MPQAAHARGPWITAQTTYSRVSTWPWISPVEMAGDVAPGDLWMGRAEVARDLTGGFANGRQRMDDRGLVQVAGDEGCIVYPLGRMPLISAALIRTRGPEELAGELGGDSEAMADDRSGGGAQ